MATAPIPDLLDDGIDYPDSDGKPMAETPIHGRNLFSLIQMLDRRSAADPMAYVFGNMFVYYRRGDPRAVVAPDVALALGVGKEPERRVYKTWLEGKGLDLVIELTSRSSKREDMNEKFAIYRDELHVSEYSLFDPLEEYLKPSLQGFRLIEGRYVPIKSAGKRLPSSVLGLEFERDAQWLRLFDPLTGERIPTAFEGEEAESLARRSAERKAKQAQEQAREAKQKAREAKQQAREAEQQVRQAEQRARQAEADNEALRRELEALRRRGKGNGSDG